MSSRIAMRLCAIFSVAFSVSLLVFFSFVSPIAEARSLSGFIAAARHVPPEGNNDEGNNCPDRSHPCQTLPRIASQAQDVTFIANQLQLVTTPTELNFGPVYVGVTSTLPLTLTNSDAADVSVTGLSSDRADVTVAFTDTILLVPGASRMLTVTYAPTSAGPLTATLTITSTSGISELLVSGSGLLPPTIEITPDAIAETLASGDLTTRTLTISNTGGSDLYFALNGRSSTGAGNILVLRDGRSENDVLTILTDAGFTVTAGPLEYLYDGTNPPLTNFGAVVLLDGETYNTDMPMSGQAALHDFVLKGGGLVLTEWFAYERGSGRYTGLSDFQLINRVGGGTNAETYTIMVLGHPIGAGLPVSFAVPGNGHNVGNVISGGEVIVTGSSSGDALVVKEIDRGRVAQMSTAAGYFGFNPWNTEMRQLLVNVVRWTTGQTWLGMRPLSGTVTPGNSATISVTLDATNLISGTYAADLRVTSNDPFTPTVTVPVTLTVIGTPVLTVTPAALDFGAVYVGVSRTLPLTVTNVGTADLSVTGLNSDQPDVTVAFTDTILLVPGASRMLTVTYAPTGAGPLTATLTITSNVGVATVPIGGTGLLPPTIQVTPTAFAETLAAGQVVTRALTISNAGSSDLDWSLSGSSRGVGSRVAVLGADYTSVYTNDVVSKLQGTGQFNSVGFINVAERTPSLAELQAYDAVLVYGNSEFANATALGNVLADYVDAGGGVVVMHFALYNGNDIQGRFLSGGYYAIDAANSTSEYCYGCYLMLGTVENPQHPVMEGVSSFNNGYYSYRSTAALTAGAAVVARYSNNEPLVVEKIITSNAGRVRRIDLNFFPPSSSVDGTFWDAATDGARLMANSLSYVAGFVSVQPLSGTVTADSSTIVSVTLDASDLISGTYRADLGIQSNDPFTPLVGVPVTLTVIGTPVLTVTPAALDFGAVYVGVSRTLQLTLTNVGTADLSVTGLNSDQLDVTTAFTDTILLTPGANRVLTVTYTPASAGPLTGTLTITNTNGISTVLMTGNGLLPPMIQVSPSAIAETLAAGQVVTRALTISNAGSSDLDWSLSGSSRGVGSRVAILGADYTSVYTNDVVSKLQATGQFNSVGFINVAARTPSLAELQAYDAVLVYGNSGFANATALGNVLADYVDAGGGVVVMHFALYNGNDIQGRFLSGGYYAIDAANSTSEYCYGCYLTLGTVENPQDPVMQGVSSFNNGYYSYRSTAALTAGAAVVARYSNNEPLVVERQLHGGAHRRIDLNFFPPSSSAYGNFWDASTDGARLMANSLSYVAGFVSVQPLSGTVTAGSSTIVSVTLDASDLISGTYRADLGIQSNDPFTPLVGVPVTVTVIGTPVLTMTPAALDFGAVYVGVSRTLQLTLTNVGTADLSVTGLNSDQPDVTVAFTDTLLLVPGASRMLTVTYAPTGAGPLMVTLTITSNGGISQVLVSGSGLLPPMIQVSPSAIVETLAAGQAVTRALTISNAGSSDLDFAVEGARANASGAGTEFLVVDHSKDKRLFASHTYNAVNEATFATLTLGELRGYQVIYFEPDWSDYGNLRNNMANLSAYIQGGGVAVINVAGNVGSATDLDPVGTDYNRSSTHESEVIAFPSHAYIIGFPFTGTLLSAADFNGWSSTDHGWLENYPVNSAVVLNNADGATWIEYRYGSGKVMLTTLTYGWGGGGARGAPLSNLIKYALHEAGISWLVATPLSGTVSAGSSAAVSVTLDATDLVSGTYRADLDIRSNDPFTPLVSVPVTLAVTGIPSITIAPAALDMGTAFAGYSTTRPITLTNPGTAELNVVSITSDNPTLTVLDSALRVPARSQRVVQARYAPGTYGVLTATLIIHSDAPQNGTLTLPVTGHAVYPPAIGFSPTSFNVSVNTDQVITRALLIQNTGLGILNFSLSPRYGYVSLYPVTGTLAPGAQQVISVTFDGTRFGQGDYTDRIYLSSNDPANPKPFVAVAMSVVLVAPEMPSNPNPQNGEVNVRMDKALTWQTSSHATMYDVRVWRDGESRPATPSGSVFYPYYDPPGNLPTDTLFHWDVLARNNAGQTQGPQWSFTTESLPDLETITVTVPAVAYSGQSFQMSWVVRNRGNRGTTASAWYDSVYLSPSPIFDSGTAIYLGFQSNPAYLDPGESYRSEATFNLPQGINGNYYAFVLADGWNYMRELDETNNTGRNDSPTDMRLTPPPDLQVTRLTGPANAFSGANVQVSWSVFNTGLGGTVSTGWYDRIYISPDATFHTTDTVLSEVYHSGVLASGEGYTTTATAPLPQAKWGDYYFFLVTDIYNQVYEHTGETNNASTGSLINITLSPPPDLVVTQLTLPTVITSGSSIPVSWVVSNEGSGDPFESYWRDQVYLSTSPVLTSAEASVLGTVAHWGGLLAGNSYTVTHQVPVPNGITGTYYIHVWTDFGSQVFEYLYDNNNVTTSAPRTILLAPSPDLQVVQVSTLVTQSVQAGKALQVSWTVLNARDNAPAIAWHDQVYLSPLPTWPGYGTLLGSAERSEALAAGERYTQTRSLVVPSGLSANIYYVYVLADAGNVVYEHNAENNNVGRSLNTIQITAPPAAAPSDLTIENLQGPAHGASGAPITVTWTVTNVGAATQATSWTDAVYLSSDETLNTSDDPRLGMAVRSGSLDSGESYTHALTVNLPNGVSGEYHLFFRADAANQVNDNNRANNTAYLVTPISVTLSSSPDLELVLLAPPATGIAGQPINFTWVVTNAGDAAANGSWYDAVYFSSDALLEGTDTRLVSLSHDGGLEVGQTYTSTATVTLPTDAAGAYYLLAKTDSRNDIYEHDAENNNVAAWPIDITVLPPSDLVVLTVTVPSSAQPSQPVSIDWTIANQGASSASGYECDAVFISADATWDVNDIQLGDQCQSINLAPGQTMELGLQALMPSRDALLAMMANLTKDMPGVTPGRYHAIVRTDIRNQIRETNDGNNIGVSTDTIQVDVPVLTLGVPVTDTLNNTQGAYYRVDVPAGETLLITLDSASTNASNELYVRYGQVPTRGVFDYSYGAPMEPDQEIVVPLTRQGVYYILAYGASVPQPASYTLVASLLSFSVRQAAPERVGNAGSSTLQIQGARFTRDTTFQLIRSDGAVLQATWTALHDSSLAYATFDLSGQPAGVYDVQATLGGMQASLKDGLTVTAGMGARIEVNFVGGPSSVRRGAKYIVYVNYANNGDADSIAPLLLVKSPSGTPLGFAPDKLGTEPLQLLAIGSDSVAGILRPGEQRSVPLYFQSSTPQVNLRLYTLRANDPSAIDWDAFESYLRPAGVSDEEWNVGWANIQRRVGDTWGDYVTALAQVATSLSQRGEITRDAQRLFTELYRQEFGYATSIISGELINVETGQLIAGAKVVARCECEAITTTIRTDVTDSAGRFRIGLVPTGTYTLTAEGYYFDQPITGTVNKGTDIAGLTLYAHPVPGELPEAPPPPPSDSRPSLAVDDAGNVHMVWQRDEGVWYSVYAGGAWTNTMPISESVGVNPVISFDPNLGGEPGLSVAWQEGFGNAAHLRYALGRPEMGGVYSWTLPYTLTSDAFGDIAPVILPTDDGNLMILWLQRDWDKEDDLDLYYTQVVTSQLLAAWEVSVDRNGDLTPGTIRVNSTAIPASWPAAGTGEFWQPDTWNSLDMTRPYLQTPVSLLTGGPYDLAGRNLLGEHCVSIRVKKGSSLPEIVPIIGGKYEFEVSGKGCGEVGCELKVSGGLDAEVSFTDYVKGKGSAMVGASWKANKETCEYDFNQAQVELTVGGEGSIPIWQPPVNIPGIKVEVGGKIAGEVKGSLGWSGSNFPAWPDSGNVDLTVGAGPYGKVEFFKVAEASVEGVGSVTGRYTPPSEFTFAGWCITLKAEAKAGILKYEWSKKWGPCGQSSQPFLSSMMPEVPGNAMVMYTASQDGEAAEEEVLVISAEPLTGTGAIYEGTPVLSDTISSDLTHDGPASVARRNGEILAAWTKDSAQPEASIGSALVVASYTAGGWSDPVQVMSSTFFNQNPSVAFDAAGVPMLLWASAPATVTSHSPVTDVVNAMTDTNIWFSRRISGAWTAPATLAAFPGADNNVKVAADSTGRVLAAWINTGVQTDTLYTVLWDGSVWSKPAALPLTTTADSLAVAFSGSTPLLVWSQASNDGSEARDVLTIHYATWDGSQWSASSPMFRPSTLVQAKLMAQSQLLDLLPTPPDDCCKCQEGNKDCECQEGEDCDQPDPPDEPDPPDPTDPPDDYDPPVVVPRDPNDILGPIGYGDARWVASDSALGYTIRYENDPALASAPAQRVYITQTLDGDLDPRRFRLGAFGFGDHMFDVPANRSFYQDRLGPFTITTTRPTTQSFNVYVDVNAGINVVTGEAFWILQTIDPATGAPPTDAAVGFLPPDVNEGDGQGFVSYSVRPRSTTHTGDVVDAQARIFFDANDPIDTPSIYNTLDAGKPTSGVNPIPPETQGQEIVLTWSGSDDAAGSGLGAADLYASTDGGPFVLAQSDITETTTVLRGQPGHTYRFFVLAQDNAGNREATKTDPEATTFLYVIGEPAILHLTREPASIEVGGASLLTATVQDGGGAFLKDQTVTFTATLGTLSVSSATTDATGIATTTLTGGVTTGGATVTATMGELITATTVSIVDVPIAGLAATNDGPTLSGDATTFTATITAGTHVTYTWALGDGGVANGATVTHTYTAVGVYTATITATNARNTLTNTTVVEVRDVPIVGLSAINDGPTNLGNTTAFTATVAAGTQVTYTWALGDGRVANGATVTHTYVTAGIYTALVTATNSVNTLTATTRVTITDVPINNLAALNSSPTLLGSPTAFTATTRTGTSIAYQWAFGDGSPVASGVTASRLYTDVGIYTALVTATNSVNTLTATTRVTITDVPISGLAALNNSPTVLGSPTAFTATIGAGTNVAYQWNFGDDSPVTSGVNASRLYTGIGFYTALVTATNSVNTLTATTRVTITATPITDIPISGLAALNNSPTVLGSPTAFTATTSTGTNIVYQWDFGDGSPVASGVNASRLYTSTGIYTALVTATNSVNTLTATTRVTITDVPINNLAALNSSPTLLGSPTAFTATLSAGTNVAYQWNFGDGSPVVSGVTALRAYTAVGVYPAWVTATNSVGVVTATTRVTIIDKLSSVMIDGPLAGTLTAQYAFTAQVAPLTVPPPITYVWQATDWPPVMAISGITHTVVFSWMTPGVKIITLTASTPAGSVNGTHLVAIGQPEYRTYLPLILK